MSDQFTEVTKTGYGSRIVGSFKGIVIGIILFCTSFVVLYWNEGRVDLSTIAKTAVHIDAQMQADASQNGMLVSATGMVRSDEQIGDGLFLNPGPYMALDRRVEMFAWVEEQKSQSKTNLGGSETTETTYTYTKEWAGSPRSSADFKYPQGHENPQKTLEDKTVTAADAAIGVYQFDPASIQLPAFARISLSEQNISLKQGALLANDAYLFIRNSASGTFANPHIGDVRVSYHALRPGFDGTIFGKLNGQKIEPYVDEDNNRLYRVFDGTREEGIAAYHSEYKMMLWIFRAVGFLMMWVGLAAIFGPISVLLDVLPLLGSVSRSVVGLVTFFVSLVLTAVTVLVSIIAHTPVALAIAVAATSIAIILFFVFWKKKKQAARA